MRHKWTLLVVLLLSSLLVLPAQAKKHHKKKEVRGMVVESVEPADNKIVLFLEHNSQELTYMVPLGTVLTLDGRAVKLEEIHKGMHVISYTDADDNSLAQLEVSTDPEAGK